MKKIKTFKTEQGDYTIKYGFKQMMDIEKEVGGLTKLAEDSDGQLRSIYVIFSHGYKALNKKAKDEEIEEAIDNILEEMSLEDFMIAVMETFYGQKLDEVTPSESAE